MLVINRRRRLKRAANQPRPRRIAIDDPARTASSVPTTVALQARSSPE